ncbi:putative sec20 domain-containing protein [Daldinia childiae]|uniref:putative sec20 domain-containing protein n=1 Tax=Daldinia childiae TaxID=326645 RepID=UPI0014484658|nr:putative sec20 domain-containing protein [Daldinia childiae]KAF3061492.1 putative sec20 domain-containing protein [Daldinia childiae]
MSHEALEKRFTDLQDRLALLQDATNQLKVLIDRLANFKFQPGSVPLGANDDDNVGSELSSEINQILREQEEELELLHEEIIDIHPGKPGSSLQHDKDRLKDGATRLEEELQNCRKAFRKAQVSAKRNLQLAQRQERELLYASFSSPRSGASSPLPPESTTLLPPSRRKPRARAEMSKEEQMLSASSDVTESMRRTHDMMAAELSKSDFAHNALKESTAALSQLSENYSSLDTMLSNSRALLGTLLKSQKTDTWYLQSAFYILVVTIGWLIFRRLLWGPTWWLVWLPLKLMFKGAVGVSNTVSRRNAQVSNPDLDASTTQSRSPQVYMNNEEVQTAQVSYQSELSRESTEAIMEEVDRIINNETVEAEKAPGAEAENDTQEEGQEKEETVLRERNDDEPPNPKKRVMEVEVEVEEHTGPPSSNSEERPKDEL